MTDNNPSFRYESDDPEQVRLDVDPKPHVIIVAVLTLCILAAVLWLQMHGWQVPL